MVDLKRILYTYEMPFESGAGVLPSIGELLARALRALGNGVSKTALRFTVPFVLAVRGVAGETPFNLTLVSLTFDSSV